MGGKTKGGAAQGLWAVRASAPVREPYSLVLDRGVVDPNGTREAEGLTLCREDIQLPGSWGAIHAVPGERRVRFTGWGRTSASRSMEASAEDSPKRSWTWH
ncbi:hypothetical protein JTB14_027637 [Gonioctena quinquepunctata]|nr:hypothetical protein JTB14_027637 [Gonioctena quinquepunctata]